MRKRYTSSLTDAQWKHVEFATIWAWRNWLKQRSPVAKQVQQDRPIESKTERVETNQLPITERIKGSGPPYYIPFREPQEVIRPAREQIRFADALRQRQQAQQLVLDIAATTWATIKQGGYPSLRLRNLSRPMDYLFLVDEQLPGNHLARLFRHLTLLLSGRDVELEMFWYDANFDRFWNPQLPSGTSLDGLARLFPEHRLVLLGDGRMLADETSELPRLRLPVVDGLKNWKEKLLLTPTLPGDWDWHEGVLYREFPLFPADLRGMGDAAAFVESSLAVEDLPASFWAWKSRQEKLRSDWAETAIDGLTTFSELQTYFSHWDSSLWRWFRALAVSSSPVWETSLAVARGLGISVTHDHLLVLARVPALQDGVWPAGLQQPLLDSLGPSDARLARMAAVRDELEAVRSLALDSHAALELETSVHRVQN